MAAITLALDDIIDKIEQKVDDPYYTRSTILDYINRLYMKIAGGIRIMDKNGSTRISPPLPGLFYIGSLSTLTSPVGGYVVSMPSNYQRALLKVFNASGSPIRLFDKWGEFIAGSPLLNGTQAVYKCMLQDKSLYFQGAPATAETLTLHYHRLPTKLALKDTTTDPDTAETEIVGIPEHLKEPLFVDGVLADIYDRIEDGLEGNKTNTMHYEGLFQRDLLDLESSIPAEGESFFS